MVVLSHFSLMSLKNVFLCRIWSKLGKKVVLRPLPRYFCPIHPVPIDHNSHSYGPGQPPAGAQNVTGGSCISDFVFGSIMNLFWEADPRWCGIVFQWSSITWDNIGSSLGSVWQNVDTIVLSNEQNIGLFRYEMQITVYFKLMPCWRHLRHC
jgi:hypothetical protein